MVSSETSKAIRVGGLHYSHRTTSIVTELAKMASLGCIVVGAHLAGNCTVWCRGIVV